MGIKDGIAWLTTTVSETSASSVKGFGWVRGKSADVLQRFRPSDETLQGLTKAASEGARMFAQAAATMAKELVESKPFRDAAKGAGTGALVAIPMPVIGPTLGALIGAGVGIYVGQKFVDSSHVEVLAGPVRDLKQFEASVQSLERLYKEGLLTREQCEQLKQKLVDSFGTIASDPAITRSATDGKV